MRRERGGLEEQEWGEKVRVKGWERTRGSGKRRGSEKRDRQGRDYEGVEKKEDGEIMIGWREKKRVGKEREGGQKTRWLEN